VSSVGIAVGPVAGGFLLDRFWWGSVFLINIPVVVAALVLGRWLVPTSKDPSAPRVDYAGAVLSMAGLSVLLWAIIGAPDRGWGDPVTIGAFLAAGTVIGAFVAWELHCDEPMLDLSVFRRARFSAASLSITLALFAMAGEIFVLTQFLQFVLGYSPLEAGLRVAPVAVVMMVVGPLSPRLVERFGSKSVVTFGLVTSAVGLALLAGLRSTRDTPTSSLPSW
jgi:MFS family permease